METVSSLPFAALRGAADRRPSTAVSVSGIVVLSVKARRTPRMVVRCVATAGGELSTYLIARTERRDCLEQLGLFSCKAISSTRIPRTHVDFSSPKSRLPMCDSGNRHLCCFLRPRNAISSSSVLLPSTELV
jgi:hypothetical protein